MPPELLHILRVIRIDHPVIEGRSIRPQRDQPLLRVAAERVSEIFEAHQAPSLIFSRSSSSASLGSLVANVPVGTSPSGSYAPKMTPLSDTWPSTSLNAPES